MKLYIKTFGCQMNVHDSIRIEEIMTTAGYSITKEPREADIALVNSCTVREKAWHKAISEVGRLRKKKARNPDVIVGMVGCVAQQEGERIFDLISQMDLVVAPDHYNQLPYLISQILADGKRRCAVGFDEGRPQDFLVANSQQRHDDISAFVTVMKGCEERCLYCIVPTVRGPERHRPIDSVVEEARLLVERGAKEITLLGQKVNAYKTDDADFVTLLTSLDKIKGLERLRFTSPHPRHMTPELTSLFGKLNSLCESIHLPVQAGSNRTLKRMRRRYTREEYLDIVSRLRSACPGIAISTDLIVGYPGETKEDFEQTLALIDEVKFSGAFSFKYSPRPGTPAAKLDDDVSAEEKARRLSTVHHRITTLEHEFRKDLIGKTIEVLIEGKARMPGQLTGRARNFQIVNFIPSTLVSSTSGDAILNLAGTFAHVEITVANPNSLEGKLV